MFTGLLPGNFLFCTKGEVNVFMCKGHISKLGQKEKTFVGIR